MEIQKNIVIHLLLLLFLQHNIFANPRSTLIITKASQLLAKQEVARKTIKKTRVRKKCSVCLEEKTLRAFKTLSCLHHEVCNACLKRMIEHALSDKQILQVRCTAQNCKKRILFEDLQGILKKNKNLERINELLFDNYVNAQKDIKYCPNSKCDYAFISQNRKCIVTCDKCAVSFCENCLIDHSSFIPCFLASFFAQRNDNSRVWIKTNTKNCPNCDVPIEKIEGCPHMTCSQCKFQFCWRCGYKWEYDHFCLRCC